MPSRTNTSFNHWNVAFEVECYGNVNEISRAAFGRALRRINRQIVIDNDYSINPPNAASYWTMEFKTKPLKKSEAMQLLKKCFALMSKHGVDTNDSCGLHANFSPRSEAAYNKLNPLKAYIDPLWAKIAEAFNREDCDYCYPPDRSSEFFAFAKKFQNGITLSPIELMAVCQDISDGLHELGDTLNLEPADDAKSTAVNFCNLTKERTKSSRIEVRAFGGDKYHEKFDLIKGYVEEAITVFDTTSNA